MELNNKTVKVEINLKNGTSQFIDVRIKWKPKRKMQLFSLPIWTPGSYTIRDHSQYLFNFNLFQNDQQVPVTISGTSSWEACVDHFDEMTLTYTVIAKQYTVRTCYLDNNLASLCLPALIVLVDGHRFSKYNLTILLPNQWKSFIPLAGNNPYHASDYDELIDAPIHAGNFIQHKFYVRNSSHKLILIGYSPNAIPNKLVDDISSTCEAACKLMSSKPPSNNKYQLFIHFIENSYGGLEHDNAAVIHYDWKKLYDNSGYNKLIQLIGHEYFHQWNVRRLRPIEYVNYDYSTPVVSENLWFSEGVTSYFELAIPLIAEIIDRNYFLTELSKRITNVLNTPGRHFQSLSDSSLEAWNKLYKPNSSSKDTQVSYYELGSLTALCLDICLRMKNSSLASITRLLWEKHGVNKSGFSRNDIKCIISNIDLDLSYEIDKWLDNPGELPVSDTLHSIGLILSKEVDKPKSSGLTFNCINDKIYIMRVQNSSPASKSTLVVGDEIISVNRCRVYNISDYNEFTNDGPYNSIIYSRRGIIYHTKIPNELNPTYKWSIIINENVSNNIKSIREKWFSII